MTNIIEEGDPSVDHKAFRRCLAQFGTGVAIVTTVWNNKPVGITINSFSSVSLDPPLILWSIARSSANFNAFTQTEHFAINFLSMEQMELAQRFASSVDDKFVLTEWENGTDGLPILKGAIGILECSIRYNYNGGDHAIIVGQATRYIRRPGSALLYVQGRFAIAENHPDLPLPYELKSPPVSDRRIPDEEAAFSTMLFHAYRTMSNGFAQHRAAEKLTFGQSWILFSLAHNNDYTIASLADELFMTRHAARDAVDELTRNGLVAVDKEGGLSITEKGIQRRDAVRNRLMQYEASLLEHLSTKEVESIKKMLRQLISQA
jgi:4-hydroxyphenylacetate 3-hydroxylase, reductase component